MDDGGRIQRGDASAAAALPIVVDERIAGGGAGLLVVALLACLRASLLRLLSVAVRFLGGREGLERQLVEAGAVAGLPPSPRLAAIVERVAADGRPVYLASRRRSPLLDELAARQSGVAGAIVVPGGVGEASQGFPGGYDAVVSRCGAVRIVNLTR